MYTPRKFFGPILGTIAVIAGLAVFAIFWIYEVTGVVNFIQELSKQLHVTQLLIWIIPLALWIIWYVVGNFRTVFAESIFFAIAVDATCTLGLAGLLTGQHSFAIFES